MNEMIVKRNALLAQKVIKGLESRNMSGYYAETKEEALKIALSLIPEGASVTMGGAASAAEIGLTEPVRQIPAPSCWPVTTQTFSSPARTRSPRTAFW